MTYTASEMREIADGVEAYGDTRNSVGYAEIAAVLHKAAQMLRQAADAMEGERRDTILCPAAGIADNLVYWVEHEPESKPPFADIRKAINLLRDMAAMQDKGEG